MGKNAPIPRRKGLRARANKGASANRGDFQLKHRNDDTKQGHSIGPWLIAFIVFVVCGSAIVQIFENIQRNNPTNAT